MAILGYDSSFAGEIGVKPRLARLICNDSLATITAAGYLTQATTQGNPLSPSDFVFIVYGANQNLQGIFTVSISNVGVITLAALPVVAGTATYTGATVDGNIAQFNNTTGELIDSGVASDSVVIYTGASVIGNIPEFDSVTGSVIDSGVATRDVQLKAEVLANTVADAGGSASFSIAAVGVTAASVAVCTFATQTNPASILTASCGVDVINIVASADAGSSTVNYIAYIAAQ